jgi:hypothetical protein
MYDGLSAITEHESGLEGRQPRARHLPSTHDRDVVFQPSGGSMRPLHILRVLALAALGVTATACDNLPAEPAPADAHAAAVTSGRPARVTLCHLNGKGEYVKVTVLDATYDLHMAHGDREVGPDGGCTTVNTSRLTVYLQFVSWIEYDLTVTQHAFGGEPARELGVCTSDSDGWVCHYDVPSGAAVTLSSPGEFTAYWEDYTIGPTRVIDTDMTVWACFC